MTKSEMLDVMIQASNTMRGEKMDPFQSFNERLCSTILEAMLEAGMGLPEIPGAKETGTFLKRGWTDEKK